MGHAVSYRHKLQTSVVLAVLCLGLVMPGHSQVASRYRDSLVGKKLDELRITDYLLNVPDNRDFTGKFKVIEFWATWCRPCLAAVPHLNSLRRKFASADSLVFISMTNEPPAKASTAFRKVSFETIVVSDQSETTHRALGVRYGDTMGLPVTVLIDDHNTIVWHGFPNQLSRQLIQKFLRREL